MKTVRPKLSPEHLNLLSEDALRMIFDGGKNTIRNAGNKAAHTASEEEMSQAILEAGLSDKQQAVLDMIYRFTQSAK